MSEQWPAWATARVEVVGHDPAWAGRAAELVADLERRLAGRSAGRVEHVGSTAVPGLAAKPVLDLLAPVTSLDAADDPTAGLAPAGWHLVPPHLDARPWRRLYVLAHGDRRIAHLHLVTTGDPHIAAVCTFRDRLRTDRGLREAYADLKREAAQVHADDREAYTRAKTPFIEAVVTGQR